MADFRRINEFITKIKTRERGEGDKTWSIYKKPDKCDVDTSKSPCKPGESSYVEATHRVQFKNESQSDIIFRGVQPANGPFSPQFVTYQLLSGVDDISLQDGYAPDNYSKKAGKGGPPLEPDGDISPGDKITIKERASDDEYEYQIHSRIIDGKEDGIILRAKDYPADADEGPPYHGMEFVKKGVQWKFVAHTGSLDEQYGEEAQNLLNGLSKGYKKALEETAGHLK